jgi:hypothetical protein
MSKIFLVVAAMLGIFALQACFIPVEGPYRGGGGGGYYGRGGGGYYAPAYGNWEHEEHEHEGHHDRD